MQRTSISPRGCDGILCRRSTPRPILRRLLLLSWSPLAMLFLFLLLFFFFAVAVAVELVLWLPVANHLSTTNGAASLKPFLSCVAALNDLAVPPWSALDRSTPVPAPPSVTLAAAPPFVAAPPTPVLFPPAAAAVAGAPAASLDVLLIGVSEHRDLTGDAASLAHASCFAQPTAVPDTLPFASTSVSAFPARPEWQVYKPVKSG